jgi:putative GTP pyrophosphokinase
MMSNLNEKIFLEKYNLHDDALGRAGLEWNQLLEIYHDYSKSITNLETTARYITENLRQVPQVHSLKYRVKDPEHLIEKIIRKKLDDASLDIQLENYREKITDLIGARALHLFKEQWRPIHKFITATWDLAEPPTANIRKGDSEELVDQFRELGCNINEHKYGYRSLHYLVESQLAKRRVIAEVQVRTIFEEGWSEIDHQTRYPYNLDNVVLGALLSLFNRLAGSADEMGTFINFLKNELETRDRDHDAQLKQLGEKIQKLEIDSKKKQELQKQVDRLTLPYTFATNAALEAVRSASMAGNIEAMRQAIASVGLARATQESVRRLTSDIAKASAVIKKPINAQIEPSRRADSVKNEETTSTDSVQDHESAGIKTNSRKAAKPTIKGAGKKK